MHRCGRRSTASRLPDDRQDVPEDDVVDRPLRDALLQAERDLGRDLDLAELDRRLAGLVEGVLVALLLRLRDAEVECLGAERSRRSRQHVVSDLVGLIDVAVGADPDRYLPEGVPKRCFVLVHGSTFRPSWRRCHSIRNVCILNTPDEQKGRKAVGLIARLMFLNSACQSALGPLMAIEQAPHNSYYKKSSAACADFIVRLMLLSYYL